MRQVILVLIVGVLMIGCRETSTDFHWEDEKLSQLECRIEKLEEKKTFTYKPPDQHITVYVRDSTGIVSDLDKRLKRHDEMINKNTQRYYEVNWFTDNRCDSLFYVLARRIDSLENSDRGVRFKIVPIDIDRR